MGGLAITMFAGITILAVIARVRVVENTCDLVAFHGNCSTDPQRTVIAQLASSVFGGVHSPLFYYVQATTALILILAANTAYNGFPMLTSILAQRNFAPRQLRTRGDRLAYSNGIVLLALIAAGLLFAYHASVTKLIQLYILGVFTSFTLSQIGMVKHWNRELRQVIATGVRTRMQVSRAINAVGAVLTGLVLVIVLATKFSNGAYLVVIAVPVLWVLMRAVAKHYAAVATELEPRPGARLLPSRVHAIVLVSRLHQPTLRAIAYARATRPSNPDRADRPGRHRGHRCPARRVAPRRPFRPADRTRLALPGHLRTRHRVCAPATRRVPPRPRRRLRPRVRRGPLVGGTPAQPERPAPQGPAAAAARRDDDQRPVATRLRRRHRSSTGASRGAAARSEGRVVCGQGSRGLESPT
jgi:hypothetical protein